MTILKKSKAALTMVVAIAMVFCLSMGAFAKEYPVSYGQNETHATNSAINVKVAVEGRTTAYKEVNVSLNAKTPSQKVIDAMLAVNADATKGIIFGTNATTPVNAESTYFSCVNGEGGSGVGYSGWCFRINGGFPMDSSGFGTTIATATITDGDVISFFIDDPISESSATKFTRANVITKTPSQIVVNVKESHQYFAPAPSYDWVISNFAKYIGATVELYSGSTASGTIISTATTNGFDGNATISNLNLTQGGTYTVKVLGNVSGNYLTSTSTTETFTLN
ncbi:MAG: hypothetical protein RR219_09110 [Clostridiales bacterium]